jgi:hypothetical protein
MAGDLLEDASEANLGLRQMKLCIHLMGLNLLRGKDEDVQVGIEEELIHCLIPRLRAFRWGLRSS